MNRTVVMLTIALVVGIAVGMIGNQILIAQQQPVQRTVLLKTDLVGIERKEALMLTVAAAPGAVGGKHYHPGHELAYVLEGSLILEVEGKPPATFKAGETFHIPPKVVHSGKNASTTAPYKVLVFGLFEKDQPDTTPVQ
jgi:quercetin dioxygenase-like cupin family protein